MKPRFVSWLKDAAIQYQARASGRPKRIYTHEYDDVLHVFVVWEDGTSSEWAPEVTEGTPEWVKEAIEWATEQ